MRPDSSALVNGVIAKLGSDPQLLALLPDNVYEDVAPPAAKRFAIVSQILATDTGVFSQGRVLEEALLLVEARVLRTSGGDAAAAAARIDALLEDGTLTVPGYQVSALYREEFVRGTEVDEVDPTIVWKRRGGRYRVTAYRFAIVSASVVAVENLRELHAEQFGLFVIGIWLDGPVSVPDPTNVLVQLRSSNPAVAPDQWLPLSPSFSDYNVTDPSAPGRAQLVFRATATMSTWAGVTFTLDDASPRMNWDHILNLESGTPIVDSLGGIVLVLPVLP
jgi:hypothetical protein